MPPKKQAHDLSLAHPILAFFYKKIWCHHTTLAHAFATNDIGVALHKNSCHQIHVQKRAGTHGHTRAHCATNRPRIMTWDSGNTPITHCGTNRTRMTWDLGWLGTCWIAGLSWALCSDSSRSLARWHFRTLLTIFCFFSDLHVSSKPKLFFLFSHWKATFYKISWIFWFSSCFSRTTGNGLEYDDLGLVGLLACCALCTLCAATPWLGVIWKLSLWGLFVFFLPVFWF